MLKATFFIALSYLLGSIPSGIIVAKILGVQDPRSAGSRNIGATNVLRLGGKTAGILTLVGDFLKGLVAVDLARAVGVSGPPLMVCAVAAVLGHMFSAFLRFQGGKGVATGLAVVTGLWPVVGLWVASIWLVVAIVFRYSSLAAMAAFIALPAIVWTQTRNAAAVGFGAAITGLIVARHHQNIRRLWAGTEARIGRDKPR